MKSTLFLPLLIAFLALPSLHAEDLQSRIKDEHAKGTDTQWIYNDIAAARVKAKAENKPLFVTFRCVPCKACKSFDGEVAQGSETIRALAAANFVSVRQVEMKGVDLSQFQFDYDLNWAAMFINADGTVYARYGTQSAEGPDAYNSIASLEQTMKRVLKLHRGYPKNAAFLAGKKGERKPYKTAMEMPGLLHPQKYAKQTERNNCIHCHNIHDAENRAAQKAGRFKHDLLWRYPLPENIGLAFDPDDGVKISKVKPLSPAALAGIKPGDRLVMADQQLMTSIADLQWVLHIIPNEESAFDMLLVRGTSQRVNARLNLVAGWKKSDVSWRGSMWALDPRLAFWGEPVPEQDRDRLKVPAEASAAVKLRYFAQQQPAGRQAARFLKNGDILIGFEGKPLTVDMRRLNTQVRLKYKVGDTIRFEILRGGKRQDVSYELVAGE